MDLIRQAISDARREGFINDAESRQLRRKLDTHEPELRLRSEDRV